MAAKDVAKSGPAIQLTVPEMADFNPSFTNWQEIVGASDTITGFDLAKDELADALTGVPFNITRIVFRPGMGVAECVASVEMILGDADAMRRRRINMNDLPWEPYSQVVFNDGSTGVYRQLIQYLVAREYIELTPEQMARPENAPGGDSRYDVRPSDFAAIHAGSYEQDGTEFVYSINVRLTCPRGLRLSEYATEKYGDAKTRYIA